MILFYLDFCESSKIFVARPEQIVDIYSYTGMLFRAKQSPQYSSPTSEGFGSDDR